MVEISRWPKAFQPLILPVAADIVQRGRLAWSLQQLQLWHLGAERLQQAELQGELIGRAARLGLDGEILHRLCSQSVTPGSLLHLRDAIVALAQRLGVDCKRALLSAALVPSTPTNAVRLCTAGSFMISVAVVSAISVRLLMEKPRKYMAAKVPPQRQRHGDRGN